MFGPLKRSCHPTRPQTSNCLFDLQATTVSSAELFRQNGCFCCSCLSQLLLALVPATGQVVMAPLLWSNLVVLAVNRKIGSQRCLPAGTSLADSSKICSSSTLADRLPHSTPGVPRRQSMVTTSVLSDFSMESVLSNLTYLAFVVEEPSTISGSLQWSAPCQRRCLHRACGHC